STTNVTIQTGGTTGDGLGNGDITVSAPITWSANRLTLSAHRNIAVNANLDGSGGGNLSLLYGQGSTDGTISGTAASYVINAPVTLPSGLTFVTQLGTTGTVKNYTVINELGSAADATTTPATMTLQGLASLGLDATSSAQTFGGFYALGSNIDASATSGWNQGRGFLPIAGNYIAETSDVTSAFVGQLEGLGNSINSLSINPQEDVGAWRNFNVGLFGRLGSGGTVSNLKLDTCGCQRWRPRRACARRNNDRRLLVLRDGGQSIPIRLQPLLRWQCRWPRR
ncbi:hypothetical protein EBZ70_13045, partial [bacterium]|nr:hypothetical protein [bacterium]